MNSLVFTVNGGWKKNEHRTSTQEREVLTYNLLCFAGEKRVIYSGAKLERTPPIGDFVTDPEGNFRKHMTIEDAWKIAIPLARFQEQNPAIDCSVF